MADIVTKKVRSRMMSGIRSRNTRPELMIRKALHAVGFRFRLHQRELPGKPDIVLKKHKAIILIHGCFWHGHDCPLFKMPSSNTPFWKRKIATNRKNDERTQKALISTGWRILTVWECSLKGKGKIPLDKIISGMTKWLVSDKVKCEIKGK